MRRANASAWPLSLGGQRGARFSFRRGGQLLEQLISRRDESEVGLALQKRLCFENVEQSPENFPVTRDLLQAGPNDARTCRGRLGKFDGRLTLGGVGDNAHLVCPVLLDQGGDLAKPVDDLLLDLLDHRGVAEMDLANIDRTEPVAPFMRPR